MGVSMLLFLLVSHGHGFQGDGTTQGLNPGCRQSPIVDGRIASGVRKSPLSGFIMVYIYVYLIFPTGVLIWSLLPSLKSPEDLQGLPSVHPLSHCDPGHLHHVRYLSAGLLCCPVLPAEWGLYESFTMSWNQQWNHTESKRLRLFLMGHGSASMDSGWEPFGLSDKVSEFHFDQLSSAFGLSKSYL